MNLFQNQTALFMIFSCIGISILVQVLSLVAFGSDVCDTLIVNGRAAKFGKRHPYNYRPSSGRGGTYEILDHGKPIYIGQSRHDVRGRLNAHIGGYDGQSIGDALSKMSNSYKEKYLQVAVKPGYQNERSSILAAKSRGFKLYNKNNGISGK